MGSRGFYVGDDADRELHRVRLVNGPIVEGRSITNAGWAAGAAIAVRGSGRDAVFKSMPR
ncbi:MAG: hypothetical protein HY785_18455 [Oscillatoriophycideae cyanobacterium NC_groundwater_1537_Pr4_S-0.65um_50_18]|nr:hypothetical protein [Oscillatoriophycideae cyanobacterium NC_groundwater_1537_Pr4_S-0.65um_50_18]